jgi:S-disulfanyl-L-cysteine oxidoreductase SoxD
MRKRSTLLLGMALIFAGAAVAAQTAPSTRPGTSPSTAAASTKPTSTRTARDGIYSDDQVARGKKAYNASCARCHGETLLGNDDASALVGDVFVAKWSSQSVGKLVEYTRKEMPSDGPGKLTRKECTDITTYVLNSNGFPAGKLELSPDLDNLNGILIQSTK